jgi:hypothetical protein
VAVIPPVKCRARVVQLDDQIVMRWQAVSRIARVLLLLCASLGSGRPQTTRADNRRLFFGDGLSCDLASGAIELASELEFKEATREGVEICPFASIECAPAAIGLAENPDWSARSRRRS